MMAFRRMSQRFRLRGKHETTVRVILLASALMALTGCFCALAWGQDAGESVHRSTMPEWLWFAALAASLGLNVALVAAFFGWERSATRKRIEQVAEDTKAAIEVVRSSESGWREEVRETFNRLFDKLGATVTDEDCARRMSDCIGRKAGEKMAGL